MTDVSQYVLPNDVGISALECRQAFDALTDKEKLYTHYISRASWYGGLIVLVQTSPESPGVYVLLQKIFRSQSLTELGQASSDNGLTNDEFQAILVYAAAIFTNMGNYKAFGDTKIIPNIAQEKFEKFVFASAAAKLDPDGIKSLWSAFGDMMYSLSERRKELNFSPKGITTYLSSNCDNKDAEIAQEFLNHKDLSAYNTRLFKTVDSNSGTSAYEIRIASVDTDNGPIHGVAYESILGTHQFTPKDASSPVTFNVTRGDYSKLLKHVVENLNKAKEHAGNTNQADMLQHYAKSFQTGSIPSHKDGSRSWIKDKGPIVESYIGFIESYRDPHGVRGEFEGFVAVVNKAMSEKFTNLVTNAEHLLPLLPWPAAYEKDTFLRPDFTSLDVVTFSGSGVPAGINIPNYDDIRQDEGFKNVSLGNVLSSGYKDTKVTFLNDDDKELFIKLKLEAFEVQVGLHELLGHGSGKIFQENKDGKLNFDVENVRHTETDEKITCWYKPQETWDSKFSAISSSYEECRAECVGIYLCLSTDVLRIFGHVDDAGDDIIYINWLSMARSGLLALEYFAPQSGAWKQAHMQGRFVILRVLIEAGEDFITIEKTMGDDDKPDLRLHVDRSKIISVGKPAIGKFLRKLQVYKSTGDYTSAKAMYDHYSDVNDTEPPHFLSLRETVLDRKQPRKMLVQHNTVCKENKVTLVDYSADTAGLIQSFVERYPDPDIDNVLQEIWERDQRHFVI